MIGEGSFKVVYLARYTSGPRNNASAACKLMREGDSYLASVYDAELEVCAKAQTIVDRFNKARLVNRKIYLNKPEVWTGTGSGSVAGWNGARALVEPLVSLVPFHKLAACMVSCSHFKPVDCVRSHPLSLARVLP